MEFELYTLLATGILGISIGTIVFSIYSYILFRVREVRKLKKTAHGHGAAPAKKEAAAETPAEATAAVPAVAKAETPGSLSAAMSELETLAAVAKAASGSRPALVEDAGKLGSTASRQRYHPAVGFDPPPEPADPGQSLEPVLALAAAVGSNRVVRAEPARPIRQEQMEEVPVAAGGAPANAKKGKSGFFKPYTPKS